MQAVAGIRCKDEPAGGEAAGSGVRASGTGVVGLSGSPLIVSSICFAVRAAECSDGERLCGIMQYIWGMSGNTYPAAPENKAAANCG